LVAEEVASVVVAVEGVREGTGWEILGLVEGAASWG
jgi:hypothetical protein